MVATSIGEEGLDIPAVDLIVFFDVVDIIRTIQRMGRTGRARDGNVVVLATEGKEAHKFKSEYDKYNYMLKGLSDPEDPLQLDVLVPGGPAAYVEWFNGMARNVF